MPSRLFKVSLLASAAAAVGGAAHAEDAAEVREKVVEEVVVTHAARQPIASVTGLPLSIRDTPVDLTASIDVAEQVRATLNVKNAGNHKHFRSLQWNQAYYAAPRSVALRLDYNF